MVFFVQTEGCYASVIWWLDWVHGVNIAPNQLVAIRVEFGETELREQVKMAGGYWDPIKKAWQMNF